MPDEYFLGLDGRPGVFDREKSTYFHRQYPEPDCASRLRYDHPTRFALPGLWLISSDEESLSRGGVWVREDRAFDCVEISPDDAGLWFRSARLYFALAPHKVPLTDLELLSYPSTDIPPEFLTRYLERARAERRGVVPPHAVPDRAAPPAARVWTTSGRNPSEETIRTLSELGTRLSNEWTNLSTSCGDYVVITEDRASRCIESFSDALRDATRCAPEDVVGWEDGLVLALRELPDAFRKLVESIGLEPLLSTPHERAEYRRKCEEKWNEEIERPYYEAVRCVVKGSSLNEVGLKLIAISKRGWEKGYEPKGDVGDARRMLPDLAHALRSTPKLGTVPWDESRFELRKVADSFNAAITVLEAVVKRLPEPPPIETESRAQPVPAPLLVEPASTDSGGRSDSKPLPEPLVLAGERDPVIVRGIDKGRVTHCRYKLLRALLEAGTRGLTGDELVTKTECSGAVTTLKTLARLDDDWKSIIDLPGRSGRKYRLNV